MMRVGVLIAAHKPTYLKEALMSALAQTHSDLEVVVVDDSMGGAVSEVVRKLDDGRITYLRNSTRLGPAASHARALQASTSPIVGILNDDDVWRPNLVGTLVAALEASPTAVLAFGDHDVLVDRSVDEELTRASSQRWGRQLLEAGLHEPFCREALVTKSVPLAVAALFRPAALGSEPMPTDVAGAYDFYLAYRLCRNGGGAVFVPQRLAAWRIHSANLTAVASPARSEEVAYVYQILVHDPQLKQVRKELVRAYGEALWSVSARHLRWGSRFAALRAAIRSVQCGHYKSALLIPALLVPRPLLVRASRPQL